MDTSSKNWQSHTAKTPAQDGLTGGLIRFGSLNEPSTRAAVMMDRQSFGRPSYTKQLTHRIPEASHGPAGLVDHEHEMSVKAVLVPKELYEHIVEAGVTKSKWRLDKQIVMGLLAGFYIGFSFTTMMLIGGQIPEIMHGENPGLYNLILGAFGFPLGLFIICVVGADLFTSNMGYMLTALHEGRVTFWHLIKVWTLSWFVNLAGCIIMAELVHFSGFFDGKTEYLFYLANKKMSYNFSQCMGRAIIANWLVNLAIWIANAAQDVTGKAVGIWLPISAFISIGGEHCIANQYLFALANLYGNDKSVGYMITHNLIPATIGNIIGGGFFVATMYSLALGTLFDSTYEKIGAVWTKLMSKIRKSDPAAPPAGRGARAVPWYEKAYNFVVSPHWINWAEETEAAVAAGATPSGLPPVATPLRSEGPTHRTYEVTKAHVSSEQSAAQARDIAMAHSETKNGRVSDVTIAVGPPSGTVGSHGHNGMHVSYNPAYGRESSSPFANSAQDVESGAAARQF